MRRIAFFLVLAVTSTSVRATDFGVRIVGRSPAATPFSTAHELQSGPPAIQAIHGAFQLTAAASIGAHWGRVTSTFRSPEHNRAVGGVPNSWHMKGRAIDIARAPGVTHAMIAAAFRAAGYRLIESLDEGDHSHFAFAIGRGMPAPVLRADSPEFTRWGWVTVASAALR